MTDIRIGSIVRALAGREKDRFMMVTDIRDGFVFLADGDERRLAAPKKKNIRHIALTKTVIDVTDELTDRRLRTLLSEYDKR
ncbi:MAG: KOW domain-containing RNA-binding protein [Oscillospiraceae bacterium]|nr:KOW domain-containing RNA-binding protein [Oscillospiraceae bacterium]